VQIKYDADVDAMQIVLNDKKSAKTIEVNKDVYVDLDEDGKATAIELLYVSTYVEGVQEILYRYFTTKDAAVAADVE